MQQQGNQHFSTLTAINIAVYHKWHHLLPIAARIAATQIHFLRHLLKNVAPNTQLHIICRCHTTQLLTNNTFNEDNSTLELRHTPYTTTIERTRQYYNLDELLHYGYTQGNYRIQCRVAAISKTTPPPKPNISLPHPPWYQSICDPYFTKTNLTTLIKNQGEVIYLANWRQHQREILTHNTFDRQNSITPHRLNSRTMDNNTEVNDLDDNQDEETLDTYSTCSSFSEESNNSTLTAQETPIPPNFQTTMHETTIHLNNLTIPINIEQTNDTRQERQYFIPEEGRNIPAGNRTLNNPDFRMTNKAAAQAFIQEWECDPNTEIINIPVLCENTRIDTDIRVIIGDEMAFGTAGIDTREDVGIIIGQQCIVEEGLRHTGTNDMGAGIEHTGTTLGRDMMGELSPQDDARTVRKVMDEGRLANEEIEIMSRRLKRRKRTQDNMRDKRTKERRKSVVTY